MIQYEPRNWLAIVFRVRGTVVPHVAGRTLMVTAISVGLVYLEQWGGISLAIPAAAHAMVGVALGLLLVFRTNASFDRYWEGRKILGGITTKIRNLRRQAGAYLRAEASAEVARLGRFWLTSVGCSLRQVPLSDGDRASATDAERALLDTAESPSVMIATWLTKLVADEANAGRLSEQRLKLFDDTLAELVNHHGAAERIVGTPVPFAYAHHIKSFLTLFCMTSPMALLGGMGVFTPIAATVVAFGLYGIDEIGVEIEDPFGDDDNDLPLEEILVELTRVLGELEP